jgi:hypothetical protein
LEGAIFLAAAGRHGGVSPIFVDFGKDEMEALDGFDGGDAIVAGFSHAPVGVLQHARG